MKKTIMFMIVAQIILATNFMNAQSTISVDYKSKGVIYQLTVWKYAAEAVMLSKPDDATVKKQYSILKAELDAAINQFQYEMNRKNKLLRKFNAINNNFKNQKFSDKISDESTNDLMVSLVDYIADCKIFVSDNAGKTIAAIEIDPLAAIELVWTIFKDLKEIQAKKNRRIE